jgi:streptogramin lyase
MCRFWRTSIALLVAMTMSGAAWAAETGTIKGKVVDSAGKGLRGAIVSAIDEDNQKSISVLTDSEGRFILDQLPPNLYTLRSRLVGFDDNLTDERDVVAGDGNKDTRFVMEPAKDLLLQRTGASLFGELKIEDPDQRMSFKMSCTYCHQVGTWGFRTPEEPVDWEVMITRMDGYGALHKDLKKTIVKKLVATYAEDAPKKWAKWTPPEAPKGKALALRVIEWDMGNKRQTMTHDLELGKDGLVYTVDMANDALLSLDPVTNERKVHPVPGGKEPYSDDPMKMGPHSLECDAVGNIWITCAIGGKMAKFDPKTEEWTIVSSAPDPAKRGVYPHTLRIDKKGVVWYTDAGVGVFSLDPNNNNVRKSYKLPAADQAVGAGVGESRGRTPYGIDVAPNGHIWYTKLNGNRVGRIKPEVPDGDVKEWNPPFRGPRRLHVAPDGMVWVPGCGSGVFAKFNPETEKWTVYDLPNKENQFPYALNIHPQTGDIWICGTTDDSMFRFIPKTEELIEYPMPSHVTYTREIEFGKDGSVWVCNSNWPNRHTERRLGSIIRITLDGTVDEATAESRAVAANSGD